MDIEIIAPDNATAQAVARHIEARTGITAGTESPRPDVPDDFFRAYITAALWSTSATVSEEDITLPAFAGSGLEIGDDYNLDAYFSDTDLAPETVEEMKSDCAEFIARCEVAGIDPFPEYPSRNEYSNAELSGHDFWLTRNGHGAGYWDRNLDTGDALTEIAHASGGCDLYVGDDGLLYV